MKTIRMSASVAALACLVLVGGLASCASAPEQDGDATGAGGSSQTPDDSGTDSAGTASETETEADGDAETETDQADPDVAFCEAMAGIEDEYWVFDFEQLGDPVAYPGAVASLRERLAAVSPPEEISTAWSVASSFLELVDDALEGVEVVDAESLTEALSTATEDTPEDFALLLTITGHKDVVGGYIQDTCGIDLQIIPPVVADACTLVAAEHLGSVFPGGVPEPERSPWGEGLVECYWDGDDDHQVGVVVGPAETVEADLLQGEPIDGAVIDVGTVDVYEGAFGPARAASGGRSAAISVSDVGVLVSVRNGGDSQAEANKAIALVTLVVQELP